MVRMAGRIFLCVSFLFVLIQATVDSADSGRKLLNPNAHHPGSPGAVNEDKPMGIFGRRRSVSSQKQHAARPRSEMSSVSPGSVRHCARAMETCSVHTPCCSPCTLCHCRLFNTICQCWKIGTCSRKN